MIVESEFQLVLQAAAAGAEWAWTALYRELSPAVLRYLRARGARDPEDMLGEVFVAVVRGIPRFAGDDRDFRAWVFTIARSRLTDEWRRRGRTPVIAASDEEIALALEAATRDGEADGGLADRHVLAVIERLSPDQRDVLFLRILAGLTTDEAATVLGKRPGAVKALQHRALEAIRRQLLTEAVSL